MTLERDASPSAGSLDAQRVPAAIMLNQAVGYDPAKGIKGCQRFTLVDTFGLLIAVQVVAGSTPEREGAKQLLQQVHQERPFARNAGWWNEPTVGSTAAVN
jgi:hypothetical protein